MLQVPKMRIPAKAGNDSCIIRAEVPAASGHQIPLKAGSGSR